MNTLVVPVRHSPFGTLTPMTARQHNGTRVGIAYSSIDALEAALHALLSPLGIRTVQVDPQLIVADLCSTAPERPVCA